MNEYYNLLINRDSLLNNISDATSFRSSSFVYDQELFTKNDVSITTSGLDNLDNYYGSLPNNNDLFKNNNILKDISNTTVKNQLIWFLKHFQAILFIYKSALINIGKLPPLMIIPDQEDESVLIDWIFKDFRIGFSFEKDENESSWYFVSNDKFDSMNKYGKIEKDKIDEQLLDYLKFIINHV